MWAVGVPEGRYARPRLEDHLLTGGPSTYPACQAEARRLRRSGARGLRAIMEEVLLPVMYDIPSRTDVAKVVITEQTVRENVNPTIVTRQPTRRERREKSA